jgi:hypothetical protein
MIHELYDSNILILNSIIFLFRARRRCASWNPIALFDPGAEVKQTAALGTERPVVIVDPGRRAMTSGA